MTKVARSFDVVVVGAGAAGLGFGATLRDLGIENFVILDRAAVGASFLLWPRQMRFITPSFNSTQFGALDLNAVCLHTSPAYSIGVEHPTGEEYAGYLRKIAEHFDLPVETGVDVLSVATGARPRRFRVATSRGDFHARFVVWAGGEMQYPRTNGFRGAELCLHNSQVTSWDDLGGDERHIIGGSESGVDAAVGLAAAGRRAVVFDREEPWARKGSDPSQLLSPFTKARLDSAVDSGRVTLRGGCPVIGVRRKDNGYRLALKGGEVVDCAEKPIYRAAALNALVEGAVKCSRRRFEPWFCWARKTSARRNWPHRWRVRPALPRTRVLSSWSAPRLGLSGRCCCC